jgi:Fe-S-cluster containining protein
MTLTEEERLQMEGVGTVLHTIAEPVDYDRDDVVYPAGWAIDPKKRTMRMVVEPGRETEPLAAGLGRYSMFGACGNLVTVLGQEQCRIYENRPQVCRDFEMGGEKCDLFRMLDAAKRHGLV